MGDIVIVFSLVCAVLHSAVNSDTPSSSMASVFLGNSLLIVGQALELDGAPWESVAGGFCALGTRKTPKWSMVGKRVRWDSCLPASTCAESHHLELGFSSGIIGFRQEVGCLCVFDVQEDSERWMVDGSWVPFGARGFR